MEIIGRRVRIVISDPWDFVTENGSYRTGTIDAGAGKRLAIRLDDPVVDPLGPVTTVVASPRFVGTAIADLLTGLPLPFNFWSEEGVVPPATWRAGFIGDLRLVT
jgi:hypothetical protein